jgi:hypothetical protein
MLLSLKASVLLDGHLLPRGVVVSRPTSADA